MTEISDKFFEIGSSMRFWAVFVSIISVIMMIDYGVLRLTDDKIASLVIILPVAFFGMPVLGFASIVSHLQSDSLLSMFIGAIIYLIFLLSLIGIKNKVRHRELILLWLVLFVASLISFLTE